MTDRPCPTPPPLPPGEAHPHPDRLGFEPFQPMVRWFSPMELVRAGAESVVSAVFGAYADNRELQAVRGKVRPHNYADREEIWVDYVADLGDGWNPTYAIAQLLAAEEAALTYPPTGEVHPTQRGDVLVLGGDQVYPTAKREEYQNRFAGPYRAALPCVLRQDEAPDLYAVPGNHDWYDGLTSFTRLFCQNRWVGGWRTRQRRSYFALALPHDWWLWGIDIQLRSDIDEPQFDYFKALGRKLAAEGVRAKIILCTAEPAWVEMKELGNEAYDTLAKFEHDTIMRHGHRHVVGLAGDLHAYARYESAAEGDERLRFVAGGGGAYLYPTHRFPNRLGLPNMPRGKEGRKVERFRLAGATESSPAVFPRREDSERLARGVWRFPFANAGFSLFFGALYGVFAWLLQSASLALNGLLHVEAGGGADAFTVSTDSFLGQFAARDGQEIEIGLWLDNLLDRAGTLLEIIIHAPLAFLLALVLLAGLVAFADGKSTLQKALMGGLHTVAQLLMFILLAWFFAWGNDRFLGLAPDSAGGILAFGLEIVLLGGLAAGFVWALYLYAAHLFGRHANEVFACQNLESYKHALRLHVARDGSLTIYPMGLSDVPTQWAYREDAGPGEAWFEPSDGGRPVHERAELIEPPIYVSAERAEVAPSLEEAAAV